MTTGFRLWWTLTGVTLLIWSFLLFGYVDQFPILTLAVIVLGLWGLGTVAGSLYPATLDRRWMSTLSWITVGLVVTGFLLWSLMQIVNVPAYGTDEIAFDQYAAQLLVHGMNPYVHSMNPSFAMFHVSPNGYTFRLDGQPVTSLSYPALSFLLYAPFYALGWSTQMAVVLNVIAWAVGMVLAYVLLPKDIRPLALVLGSLSVYIGYAVGGVTDALFVPLLIGAIYQWDRYPSQRGWAALRSPVLLGLAMAVKQTPWLLLPFLAIGIWLEARRSSQDSWRVTGKFVGIAGLAFLIPNLPFRPEPPCLGVGNPHPDRQPRRSGWSRLCRLESFPRHWRGIAGRLLDRLDCGVCRAGCDLLRHLPLGQGDGAGFPGRGPVLFCSVLRQLSGDADAGGDCGRTLPAAEGCRHGKTDGLVAPRLVFATRTNHCGRFPGRVGRRCGGGRSQLAPVECGHQVGGNDRSVGHHRPDRCQGGEQIGRGHDTAFLGGEFGDHFDLLDTKSRPQPVKPGSVGQLHAPGSQLFCPAVLDGGISSGGLHGGSGDGEPKAARISRRCYTSIWSPTPSIPSCLPVTPCALRRRFSISLIVRCIWLDNRSTSGKLFMRSRGWHSGKR